MDNSHVRPYIQLSGELFEAVQKARIFSDSKHFVDMTPVGDPEDIKRMYQEEKDEPDFDLKEFVNRHFSGPSSSGEGVQIEQKASCRDHIRELWPSLFRSPDSGVKPGSTLLPLPKPYVVPGGRFREIYYWDSYFTAQGLNADGYPDMVLAMAENFRHLINTTGHIPNGNRAYYLSRSQPPFFAPMADMVVTLHGSEKIRSFLPAVEKEYMFWMDETGGTGRRSVKVETESGPVTLNRYWDDFPAPREESWYEDMKLAEDFPTDQREKLFRNIRAACESGWDFSSRWFADVMNLSSMETTNILPVDLNSLIWYMEEKLADWYRVEGETEKAQKYTRLAAIRKSAIQDLMWSDEKGFFFDYRIDEREMTDIWSLAAVYPLYFGMAEKYQAESVASHLENKFLKDGGLITTTVETGQQWDSPNGWAPLQWMAYKGLQRYGLNDLALTIRSRWMKLNKSVYLRTGKMVEKYNVEDLSKKGGGGEYPLQDGFGWSNGVYSALAIE
ncbi:alpha,alpha-trehalase TreF [Rhodohalobacter mucosus]|uniref:Trehalase n=1 Tax=Rhodohalobacter mucosus TaxID=2079485 RepID=A0A316TMJ9_9BACT|nr:alpha,alpha-trehalase TreF [Rhodohalobacter mucosus]PWN05827.1 trehalase [Rhodohalobacter mucosus]